MSTEALCQARLARYVTAMRNEVLRGIPFRRQVPLPLVHKGVRLECGYRVGLVVADAVIVEIKGIKRVVNNCSVD